MNLHWAVNIPFGANRRQMILDQIKRDGLVYINSISSAQSKCDPDIRRLIKEGKVKQERIGGMGRCSHTVLKKHSKRNTILVIE